MLCFKLSNLLLGPIYRWGVKGPGHPISLPSPPTGPLPQRSSAHSVSACIGPLLLVSWPPHWPSQYQNSSSAHGLLNS